MAIKVSYIVPCFNVEKYVLKCLKSIVSQELNIQNYEIIIINDGSTDKTLSIIKSFIETHLKFNIILIDQNNYGQSYARNKGLEYSKGKYIWFVDSDDYLNSNISSTLLDFMDNSDLDLLWFNHKIIDENYNALPLPVEDSKERIPIGEIFTGNYFLENYFGKSCMPWMFIFSRKYLLANSLKFLEGRYFEDILFTSTAIDKAKKISYLNVSGYNYLIRHTGSTMRDPLKLEKRTLDALHISIEMKRYAEVANCKEYFLDFSNIITTYHLRQASKVSRKFFMQCHQLSYSNGLLPISSYANAPKTKIVQKIINLLGLQSYYILRKLK